MKNLALTLILAVVAMACQIQEDPMPLTDQSSSGSGVMTTAASYSNSYSFSPDGKTLTLTVNAADGSAKNISHMNFKFTNCDGSAVTVGNITAATATTATGSTLNVFDKLGSTEGNNDCFGMLADPFVKLNQGFTGFPVVLVLSFDTSLSGGQFLLKAGSSNSQNGGGCFGLNDPNYTFSRSCTPPPSCFNTESAWATGPRFVTRGNWATYTPYQQGSVNIYAGQSKFAGTATMSAVSGGNVTITIALNSGWSLQNVSNPVKIQGYSVAPSGNPSPGRFASKGTSLTVTVPAAGFYGIHLDVQEAVTCPN